MSQTNTLNIVIDPSGALAGARTATNAINGMNSAVNNLNISILQINSRAAQSTSGASKHFNSFSTIVERLGNSVSGIAGLIAAVQPIRLFQGFLNQIQEVDKTYNGFLAMMSVTTNDIVKSAEAYEYIKNTANAYGVSLEVLTKQYAKLSAATKGLMSETETKRLFESFTAVSTVLHAEHYTVTRMFNAIIQMASKGQIHMEELKQQLGEHLPGALALAAEAMNMDMGQMIKAMERGEIKARDLLVPLPQTLMDRFGEAAEIASRSLHATYTRLRNAVFDMFKEMSTSGVSLGMAEVLQAITNHVKTGSDSFKVMGEVIGVAMLKLADFIKLLTPDDIRTFTEQAVKLVEALISFTSWLFKATGFLIDHSKEIVLAAQVYVAYKAMVLAAAAGSAVFTGATVASAAALIVLKSTLGLLAAAASGWMFGTYLREKFAEVEMAGIALAAQMTKIPVNISAGFEILKVQIPKAFAQAFESAINHINTFITYVRNLGPKMLSFLGFGDGELKVPVKLDFTSNYDAQIADIRKNHAREISAIDDIYADMFSDAKNRDRSDGGQSFMDRIGLSEEQFTEAQSLVDRFNQLKLDAEALTGLNTGETVGQGGRGKGKNAFMQEVRNTTTEALNEYKYFVEQLATLKEFDQITTGQAFTAQIAALENYTSAVVDYLTVARSLAADPRQREQINAQLMKVEHDYQIGMTRLLRDQAKDREEFMKSVEQAEIDSGVIRLNNLDEFVRKWKEKEGKLMQRAQMEGDTSAVDQLLAAFKHSVEEIREEDRIDVFKIFASDEELWLHNLTEQYDKMRDIILDSTYHTYSEKHALIEQLEAKFAAEQRNRQIENLLSFTGAAGDMVGQFANFAKNIAGETSGAYRALFAISKAFAIADSMMKVQQAIAAAAASGPFPWNLGAMASVASALGGVVSTISSTNFSGAYDDGGSIPSGKWGIVGEVGPEIVQGPANVTSRKDTEALLSGSQQQKPEVNIKNINVIDPSLIQQYLATDDGEQMIMNVIRRNQRELV